jgi:hypothetical protein
MFTHLLGDNLCHAYSSLLPMCNPANITDNYFSGDNYFSVIYRGMQGFVTIY